MYIYILIEFHGYSYKLIEIHFLEIVCFVICLKSFPSFKRPSKHHNNEVYSKISRTDLFETLSKYRMTICVFKCSPVIV